MTNDPITILARLAATIPHDGVERSFKMTQGMLLTQRVLYGINKSQLTLQAALTLAAQLHMPDEYGQILGKRYGAANFIYLGCEQDELRYAWKWYLEFPVYIGTPQHGRPAPLYIGLKWDAGSGAPIAITDYIWRVHLPLSAIYACIEAGCGSKDSVVAQCATGLLDLAARRAPVDQLVLLEVSEAGLPRRSFDINLYAANLLVGDVAYLLRTAAQHLAVSPLAINALLVRTDRQPLGHVAGGLDRRGRDFLTLYYEV